MVETDLSEVTGSLFVTLLITFLNTSIPLFNALSVTIKSKVIGPSAKFDTSIPLKLNSLSDIAPVYFLECFTVVIFEFEKLKLVRSVS